MKSVNLLLCAPLITATTLSAKMAREIVLGYQGDAPTISTATTSQRAIVRILSISLCRK